MSDLFSLNQDKRFVVNGQTYKLVKARAPTMAEMMETQKKQAMCPHNKGVHFTDPLTCAICGKEMK